MHLVEENISLADIVRGSDEDFENLFGLNDNEEIFKRIQMSGCLSLVLTRGKLGSNLFSEDIRLSLPAKNIAVVSTIGAGDAFNAGIIFGLIKNGMTVNDLVNITQEQWIEILGFGVTFASDVCQSFDNYISIETGVIARG
jgi:fructokinase